MSIDSKDIDQLLRVRLGRFASVSSEHLRHFEPVRQEEPFQIVSQCVPTLHCELLHPQFSVRRLDLEALEPVLDAALGIESKGVPASDTVSSSRVYNIWTPYLSFVRRGQPFHRDEGVHNHES